MPRCRDSGITGSTDLEVLCPGPAVSITAPATAIEHQANYVASVAPVDGATYAWSISDGFLTRGADGPTAYFTTGAAGKATLTLNVTGPNQCTSTTTKTIAVLARPTASLPASLATCGPGDVEIPVTLTGTPPFTLVWSDGVTQSGIASRTTSRTVSVVAPESYSIASVTDANASGEASNACAVDVDAPVEIDQAPADVHVLPGETATFTITAFGPNLHYAWFYGTAGDARFPVGTDSPSFTTWAVTKPLSFWARVWNGCGNVDTAAVTATPVPQRRRAAGAP